MFEKFLSEDAAATAMHANIPFTVIGVFSNAEYKGGPLLVLPKSGAVRTPTATEISKNYMWLLPLVKCYPSKAR